MRQRDSGARRHTDPVQPASAPHTDRGELDPPEPRRRVPLVARLLLWLLWGTCACAPEPAGPSTPASCQQSCGGRPLVEVPPVLCVCRDCSLRLADTDLACADACGDTGMRALLVIEAGCGCGGE